jgi:putative copper export protein
MIQFNLVRSTCASFAEHTFWNPPPAFLGSLLLAGAIFLRARYYFHPEKFSPKFTRRMVNWLTGIIAVCGIVQIVLAAFDQLHTN